MRMKITPEKPKYSDSGLGLDPGPRLGSTPLRHDATGGVVSAVSHPQLILHSQSQRQQHQAYGPSPSLPVSTPVSVPKGSRGVGTSCDLEGMKWQENGKMNSRSKAEAEVPVLMLAITKGNAEMSRPKDLSRTVAARKTEGSAKERSLEAKLMVPKKPRGKPRKIKKPDDVIWETKDKDLVERLRSTVVVESGAEEEEEREVFQNNKADKLKSASGSRMKYQDVAKSAQDERIVDSYDDIQEERTDDEKMTSKRNETVERIPDAKKEIQPVSKKRGRPKREQPAEAKDKEEEQAVISKRRAIAEREDAKNPDEISVPVASTAVMTAATATATIQAPNPNPTIILAQCAPVVNQSTRLYDEMRLARGKGAGVNFARTYTEFVEQPGQAENNGETSTGSALSEMQYTLEVLRECIEAFGDIKNDGSNQEKTQPVEKTVHHSIAQTLQIFQATLKMLMHQFFAALNSNAAAPVPKPASAQTIKNIESQQLLISEQHLHVIVPAEQKRLDTKHNTGNDHVVGTNEADGWRLKRNVGLHKPWPNQMFTAPPKNESEETLEISSALAFQRSASQMHHRDPIVTSNNTTTKPLGSLDSGVGKTRRSSYPQSEFSAVLTKKTKPKRATRKPTAILESSEAAAGTDSKSVDLATKVGTCNIKSLKITRDAYINLLRDEFPSLTQEREHVVLAKGSEAGTVLYPMVLLVNSKLITMTRLRTHPHYVRKTDSIETQNVLSFVLLKIINRDRYVWAPRTDITLLSDVSGLDAPGVTIGNIVQRTKRILKHMESREKPVPNANGETDERSVSVPSDSEHRDVGTKKSIQSLDRLSKAKPAESAFQAASATAFVSKVVSRPDRFVSLREPGVKKVL